MACIRDFTNFHNSSSCYDVFDINYIYELTRNNGLNYMDESNFFQRLTPGQGTLLGALFSAGIALLVVFITKHFDSKKQKKEQYDTVKKYANPIIFATEQFAWRLREILNFNAAYLLADAPLNDFFKYKFDSTVYRLCAVLGWIQAAKKEQSYLDSIKMKNHAKVQLAVSKFHQILADGSHVEVAILVDLCKLFDLNLNITDNEKSLLGVQLERVVFKYIPNNLKKNVAELEQSKQIQMLEDIMGCICDKLKYAYIDVKIIEKKRNLAVKEISREYCWIYRDWQASIGDEMIEPIQGANRRFDVIGFSKFLQNYQENIWLKKVDNLFINLDITTDNKFDTRVIQLKQLFGCSIELIEALKVLVNKQETISDKSFQGLKTFNEKIKKVATN